MKNKQDINTIVFDLSDVYLHGLAGIEKHINKKIKKNVKHTDLFMVELHHLFHGEITEDVYWEAVIKKREWNISIEELKSAVRANFKEIKGTRNIIENLRKQGYKMGLLSIHAKEWVDYCEDQFDYHKLFDVVTYSFNIQLCKPEKKTYEYLLDKLGVKAQNSLFIDDNNDNIVAAQELGMHAIQFTSAHSLKEKLKGININLSKHKNITKHNDRYKKCDMVLE